MEIFHGKNDTMKDLLQIHMAIFIIAKDAFIAV